MCMESTTVRIASRRALRRGLSALRRGDPDTAERWLAEALAHADDNAEAWHYRAIAAHQRGANDNASAWFDHAATLAPARPDFTLDRALYLLETGNPKAALSIADEAAHDPAHAERAALIGAEALLTSGSRSAAAERLRRFLQRHPRAPAARMRLYEVLEELGEDDAALDVLQEAIAQDPNDATFGPLLATALRRTGCHDEADMHSRRLAASPRSPAIAWFELAVAAAQRGNAREALEYAREALQRDRNLGNAWLLVAELSDSPAEIEAALPNANTATMQFARARVLDRTARYPEAWEVYGKANELAARELGNYIPEQQTAYVDDLITHLDAACVEKLQVDKEPAGPAPVFICGVSRSGTTLVEQMLAAHPSGRVQAGGEMRTVHKLLRRKIGAENLMNTGSSLASLPSSTLRELIAEWRRNLGNFGDNDNFITDKMPSNAFLLGLIHAAFPSAPIILVERDPSALACSCFTTPFAEGHAFSHRLEDIAHYFSQFRRIAMHWEALLPPGAVIHLRYETLLAAPEDAMKPVLDALGLNWDKDILAFHHRREPIATASLAQVRTPLNQAAGERWLRFETQLAPWSDRLHRAYWHAEPGNGLRESDASAYRPGT